VGEALALWVTEGEPLVRTLMEGEADTLRVRVPQGVVEVVRQRVGDIVVL